MPPLSANDRELLGECDVHTFRAGGPGGQHRNVTDSAVRLVHRPSGIVVTSAAHRSQYRNKREALEVLRKRLAARRRRKKPRVATRPRKGAVESRLEGKRQRSTVKRNRRRVDRDGE